MDTLSFKADEKMIADALQACETAVPNIGIHKGRIVSGDQFVSDPGKKKSIIEEFKGKCTEMEGAAIAQTAYLNGIPCEVIRNISDKADDSAT